MKLAALFMLATGILAAQSSAQEPSQIVGIGAGVQGLGPAQVQGGYFMAQRVAAGLFTVQATDFVRMPGGKVGTSARAGLAQILRTLGPCTFGIIGDAGVAEGQTGSASGAISGWGYLLFRIANSPFGLMGAAQTVRVAGTGQTSQFRLIATYSFYK